MLPTITPLPAVPAKGSTDWYDDYLAIRDRLGQALTALALAARAGSVIYADENGVAASNTAAQNDAAIAACITKAQAAGGGEIRFPAGDFKVSAPINAKATSTYGSGIRFRGAGRSLTKFTNQTLTSDLMWVGGFNNLFEDFTIQHTDASVSNTSTHGDGLKFYKCAYSQFNRVQIMNVGRAVAIAQENVFEPGTTTGSANWMFSCSFDGINVTRYAKNALFLNAFGGGATGSTWDNLYLQNVDYSGNPIQSAGHAIDLLNCDFTGGQVNVEDLVGQCAILANAQSSVTIQALHLERTHMVAGGNPLVRSYGGAQISVDALSVSFSDMARSGSSGATTILSAAYYGQLSVNHVLLNNNLKTVGVNYTVGEVGDTGNSAFLEFGMVSSYQSPAYTALSSSTANPGLLRAGNKLYGLTT